MKAGISKLKSRSVFLLSSIILIIALIMLSVSIFTKYFVQKYVLKYTGRQITFEKAFVNPFTGYFYFNNIKIYEYKSDSVFLYLNELSANINILKIFTNSLEISNLTFYKPRINIVLSKGIFNFNDIVSMYSSHQDPHFKKEPYHFNFFNIKIIDGHFFYTDDLVPVKFSIKSVNIESKNGWGWNTDDISAKISFLSETGTGGMNGNFGMNIKNLDYTIDVVVNTFDINVFAQYLRRYVNYGSLSANLDAKLKTNGSFKDAENSTIKGQLSINDFHFGKNPAEDYLSFDKALFYIKDLSPAKHQYLFDSLMLDNSFFKYERYDSLDNLENIFGKKGANFSENKSVQKHFNLILTIADYIKALAKNFFESDYKISKLSIHKGCVQFNDFSLSEKFSVEAKNFNLFADSINKNRKRVNFYVKSDIQPYGKVVVNISVNPNDSMDFDMQYQLKGLPVSILNPYLINYTSFPFNRGTIEVNGKWMVRNSIITSKNHLLVFDPRITNKRLTSDSKWLPMPLIMYFILENDNVIDYEIPISGNLKNPRFHLKNIFIDILENIFIKPVTIPYRTEVRNTENKIEKLLTLKWNMRQSSLLPYQEKFVNLMAGYLLNNPDEFITVYTFQFEEKEKEYILFFEAKKKYYLLSKEIKDSILSDKDSLKIDKISVKDPTFVHFMNNHISDSSLFTIQEKCNSFIGSDLVNIRYKQLNIAREDAFVRIFKKLAVENRVKINTGKNKIPYNGFSFYKIIYKGVLPVTLTDAYQRMNEFNNESPRKRLEKEREKIKNSF